MNIEDRKLIAFLATGMAICLWARLVLAADPKRSDVWISGAWSDSAMTEAAEMLQPTGTTGFTGASLAHLPPQKREKKRAYIARRKALARKLGIGKLHFAVHLYHRRPNFPDSAVRIAIAGERWRETGLDPERTGDKARWTYCKSHDEFRDAVIENIRSAIDGGADVINLQDFDRGETQCVCDRCAEKFRRALLSDPRYSRFREPLRKKGIADLSEFHIREYLLARTHGDAKQRMGQFYRTGALWNAWQQFKYDTTIAFLRAVTEAGREHARKASRKVAFVQHFWYLRNRDVGMSDSYDGVWPETPLLYYGAQPSQRRTDEYRLGIAVYPPNGAMGSIASVMRGVGYRCPPILIGYGGDWYHRVAFKRGPYARLLQVWTAEVYASGGTMQYLYRLPENQLLSRDIYKRLRAQLLPAFFDRDVSPAEYRCPLEAVGQYTRFIRAHADLYDNCEPPRYLLLLEAERAYDPPSRQGPLNESIFAWAQLLDDAHIPYRVLLDGGARKRARLSADTLQGYRTVLALGGPDDYVESQLAALKQYAAGGRVAAIGNGPAWQRVLGRKDLIVLKDDLGARYQLEGRNAALTEEVRRVLGTRAVETNAGPNVLVKLEHSPDGSDWRVHVVNRNYRWLEDEVEGRDSVTLTLDKAALGLGNVSGVRAFSPDGAESAEVRVRPDRPGLVRFEVPRLSIYTVITFHARSR